MGQSPYPDETLYPHIVGMRPGKWRDPTAGTQLTQLANQQRHIHFWDDPPVDTSSRDAIVMTLCGQICACGARRVYEGPELGWREL